jgi:hypothetical protein
MVSGNFIIIIMFTMKSSNGVYHYSHPLNGTTQ